jgi:hypothetical protein
VCQHCFLGCLKASLRISHLNGIITNGPLELMCISRTIVFMHYGEI